MWKTEERLCDLWGPIKSVNIRIIEIPEWEKKMREEQKTKNNNWECPNPGERIGHSSSKS